ncbi:glycosyltransferase family A protein [Synechococcus sp. RSCCF101]|uniref:glycosyltransferase family 2 protein n=1 Tax=Synechococcus sp. RSCCF101 TaxID=2511069 RepID=UPI001781298B|nr:glycosyltransferase family A protein [Synechococcus sp. RSCCF101]
MLASPVMSVVMPFRNARRWLPRTLVALAGERSTPFELVAIDDGSSDGSAELVQRLTHSWGPGRVQIHATGGIGVSSARNLGVNRARSPLIAFLDADDPPLPGRLAQPLARLEQESGLAQVLGGWRRIDERGRVINAVRPWQEGAGFSLLQVYGLKAVLPSAWTIRRTVFESVGGFDQRLRHAEDVDLLLRLAAQRHGGAWIEELLVDYRQHPGGATRRWREQIDVILDVMERALPLLPADRRGWGLENAYFTALWCVWKIWCEGAQDDGSEHVLSVLAHARRFCTMPLVRRMPHFLETMARTARYDGMPLDREAFLASPLYRRVVAVLTEPAAC